MTSILHILGRLAGQRCSRIVGNDLTSPEIRVDFGRTFVVAETSGPSFYGEFDIFFSSAAWRIRRGEEVLASCKSSLDEHSAAGRALRTIVGELVESASLSGAMDVCITFADGIVLEAFCVDPSSWQYSVAHRESMCSLELIDGRLSERHEFRQPPFWPVEYID